MNLFTDAYFTCACGRLSLCRVCPLCVVKPVDMRGWQTKDEESKHKLLRELQARVGVDVELLDALEANQPKAPVSVAPPVETTVRPEPVQEPLSMTPAMRAAIEEGKRTTAFLSAGVFDLWGERQPTGELTCFAVAANVRPSGSAIPLLRVRRIDGGLRQRWREVPLLPLVRRQDAATVTATSGVSGGQG